METSIEHKKRMRKILKQGFVLLAIGAFLMYLTTLVAINYSLISLLKGFVIINVITLTGCILAVTLPWGKKRYSP